MTQKEKLLYALAFVSLAAIPLWICCAAPLFTPLPANLSFEARLLSFDDFYNEKTGEFNGPTRSVTKLSTEAVETGGAAVLLNHSFSVYNLIGEEIFVVKRLYAVDPITRRHLREGADREREGYFFSQRHLKKGGPFTTWWVNYDGPAHMTFSGEELIRNLKVYRYEARYEGVRIEQTDQLGNLPGVPEERGVVLEPHLTMWIEPVTGRLVNFTDETTAYYFDIKTGVHAQRR